MRQVLIICLFQGVQTNLIFDQGTWKVIDSMTGVYTESSVLSSHQDVTCIECAARTLMLDGEGYSCNRGDQMCMIYSTCHIKDRLAPGDWEPIGGWLHFCTSMHLRFLRRHPVIIKQSLELRMCIVGPSSGTMRFYHRVNISTFMSYVRLL